MTLSRQLPPHPELPFPPAGRLNQHFILGEIRDYLEEFNELFPHVNLRILHDLVTAVRRKNVDPEVNLRQFLQAFQDTTPFHEALELLDSDTRKRVEAFRDGASAHDLTEKKGFALPPSAPAKKHFRLLDQLHALFHPHDEEKKPRSKPAAPDRDFHTSGDAVIYEDADNKKVMKVWCITVRRATRRTSDRCRSIQGSGLKIGGRMFEINQSTLLCLPLSWACKILSSLPKKTA